MTQDDRITIRGLFTRLKEIRNRVSHMKPSYNEEAKLNILKKALREAEYCFEDFIMNMENRQHWGTIKKFVKEKHIL